MKNEITSKEKPALFLRQLFNGQKLACLLKNKFLKKTKKIFLITENKRGNKNFLQIYFCKPWLCLFFGIEFVS